MRQSHILALGLGSIVALFAACQDDESSSTSSSNTNSGPTTSTMTTSSGGNGGTGGMSTTTTTSGGNGGTGGGTGGSGGMVNLPTCNGTDQLLISELRSGPQQSEFVEIWNPTGNTVDLTSYHLADNKNYYQIADGSNYMPLTENPGSDFLIRFPAGTMIGPNEVITIAFGTDWSANNAGCPDLTVQPGAMCNNAATPQMMVPSYGLVGTGGNQLSGGGEMLMLFCWDGGSRVYDVDYVMYDPDMNANDPYYTANRVDKTNVSGYAADTPLLTQLGVVAPQPSGQAMPGQSLQRCDATENGETMTGGNGLLGHDETSENFAASFEIHTPTPGMVNTCN